MPLYPFACDGCGAEFEVMRRPAAMRDPAPCPACDAPARRLCTGLTVAGQAAPPSAGGGQATGGWSHGGHSHGAGTSGHTHGTRAP